MMLEWLFTKVYGCFWGLAQAKTSSRGVKWVVRPGYLRKLSENIQWVQNQILSPLVTFGYFWSKLEPQIVSLADHLRVTKNEKQADHLRVTDEPSFATPSASRYFPYVTLTSVWYRSLESYVTQRVRAPPCLGLRQRNSRGC